MRILILTFYYEPDLCAGSFRNTALVSALKNNLHEDDKVDIVTTMPNRYNSYIEEALEEEKHGNIFIKRIQMPKHKSGMIDQAISFTSFAWKAFLYINKKEKYDIVFSSSSRLMTAFLGAVISNRHNAKLFLDMRDIFTDTMTDIFKGSKFKYIIPLFEQIEKYTINSAYHINLVSKGFETYFTKINNTISYSFYSNGIDNIFLNYDFKKEVSKEKIIITYAGNIGEGQGLEKIIPDMAKLLPDNYEIHIVGDGAKKELLTGAVSGFNNVKLFSAVDRNSLLKIYKNSDYLFLHLNDYNAFKKVLPSKIFEFASTNKFIIAGVNGFAKEFIEKNIESSIVFSPCDASDFIKKFKQIEYTRIDRRDFITQYSRDNIMQKMADRIYNL